MISEYLFPACRNVSTPTLAVAKRTALSDNCFLKVIYFLQHSVTVSVSNTLLVAHKALQVNLGNRPYKWLAEPVALRLGNFLPFQEITVYYQQEIPTV